MIQGFIARFQTLAAVAAIFAVSCGGGSSSSSTSTAAPAMTATMSSQMNGAPMTKPAPIPADLHCASAIVWVNLSSKTYHRSDDPYYGRTKHGEYMCEAAADAKGYHLAGSSRHHRTQGEPTPEPYST